MPVKGVPGLLWFVFGRFYSNSSGLLQWQLVNFVNAWWIWLSIQNKRNINTASIIWYTLYYRQLNERVLNEINDHCTTICLTIVQGLRNLFILKLHSFHRALCSNLIIIETYDINATNEIDISIYTNIKAYLISEQTRNNPDNKVHGATMEPIWGRQDPGGPHVGPLNLAFYPDSKVHGANMEPIWGRQDPGGPHVGPMTLAIWGLPCLMDLCFYSKTTNTKQFEHKLFRFASNI